MIGDGLLTIRHYVYTSGRMDIADALKAFSALSQETRLKVFKILVEHGKEGVAAGALSTKLDIPHNTLSFHLSHLSNAGLVTSHKESRSVIYFANLKAMKELINYLVENCCASEAEGCGILEKLGGKQC
jgi:DNA-binding transcriptional ArsR family regulator